MLAHRAHPPRRLAAGLATAAVLTAGLACAGTAHAAEPTGLPRTIGFQPLDLVTTASDVYAVGDIDTDGSGEEREARVEAIGSGASVRLGADTEAGQISATPDGGTLYVLGSRPDGGWPANTLWTVNAATMQVTDTVTVEGRPYALAAGAAGAYVAYTGMSRTAVSGGSLSTEVPGNLQANHLEVLPGAGGTESLVLGATDYDESGDVPTLRTITAAGVSERIVLGPDEDHRGFITDLDVDEARGLTYAVTAHAGEDGTDYGLNIIGAGVDRYVPLGAGQLSAVDVSPDGKTVYLSGHWVSAHDVDALESYTEENPAPGSTLPGSTSVGVVEVAPSGRIYVAGQDQLEDGSTVNRVHAIETPGAPTSLTATADEEFPGSVTVTWAPPADVGGVDPESLTYPITVQDRAGGQPVVDVAYGSDYELQDLEVGHTYTVSLATSNGAFTSAAATTTVTVKAPVAAPSRIAVRGKSAVGSKLTVANTGSWTSGTTLSYVWTNDRDQVVSKSSSLTLTKAHLGRRIYVQVTGTKAGFAPVTVYGSLGGKIVQGTLVARMPSVTGAAKVGKKLTAKTGAWTPGTAFSYRWTANGKVIKGATASTLKLKAAQAGKQIRVVVTGTKPGYRPTTKTSNPTAKVKR
ncbi:fibronectin type III domain-containing protein [Nocardioides sp. cx-169]|uniref:fibronectin type III domain-containing protein n=1 Tax=Nocardioides sp. cx-169 TaxID=2899080 RepID=UPI001E53454F|nr:fibronectin type III domain-containing protein [Nocardioides sp. cx-169]MCD4536311.1 fibronectin type III domain-containing protein [Nocardioides sp. cx-169]